jgi:sugar diacid utilization regulator
MNLTPITLTSSRIEYSDIFTKTLYIQFKSSRTLSSLSRIIQNAVSVKNNYKLNLHLSLLYAHIQKEEQQRVLQKLKSHARNLSLIRLKP